MTIIEFLLKHWIIVVIAYMALSAVAKRMRPPKSGEAPPKKAPAKPAQGMPPFGGGGSGWPGSPGDTGMTKAASAPRSPKGDASLASPVPRDKGQRDEAAYASPPARMEGEEGRRVLPAIPDRSAKPSGAGERLLSPQDAAKGVLWAEILGPPRAKRPYRR